MAGNRTLKLSILADVDNLKKGLNQADDDVQGFGGKLESFAKTAGIAFAAAGVAAVAYAGKLAIDGVKAAIADEAAQAKLAATLKNVTGATEDQTKAVEAYILKTELAYGVTDEQLRPSLDRLVRSTKDVAEAQRLQTLALNIAAGTGKDLQAVSEALARAHDGNFASLKRLGVSIDDNIIKSKDFDAATKVLSETFANQANIQADTFQGKLDRLKIGFEEAKETIGAVILDALQPLVNLLVKNIIPAVSAFTDSIGGADGLKATFEQYVDAAKKIFIPIFEGIQFAFNKIKKAVTDNKDEFEALFNFIKNFIAPILGGVLKYAIEGLGSALSIVINLIGGLIKGFETAYNAVKKFVDFIKNNPVTKFFTGSSFSGASFETAAFVTGAGSNSTFASSDAGGSYMGGSTKMTPEQQARFDALKAEKEANILRTEEIKARIAARARGEIFGTGGSNVNINIGVAGDPEGTARTIVDLLNSSSSRGTLGADALF